MGEDLADDAEWFARLTIEGADSEYRVASSADADLAVDVIRPADDGLRIVHTGDATILERQDAAERVHWADDAVVEEDSDARVELLASGSLGAATAVLDEAPSASVDSGSNAAIEVVDSGSTDRQQFRVVVEDGDGLLVVEDSFRRPGWSATVDGEPVEMIAADHVAAAVALDEGQHEVVLSYSPPGLAAGTIATLITLLGLAAGYGAWWFRSRRRSPGQSD
nr:YfhO family protein [Agromyces luteolus]